MTEAERQAAVARKEAEQIQAEQLAEDAELRRDMRDRMMQQAHKEMRADEARCQMEFISMMDDPKEAEGRRALDGTCQDLAKAIATQSYDIRNPEIARVNSKTEVAKHVQKVRKLYKPSSRRPTRSSNPWQPSTTRRTSKAG